MADYKVGIVGLGIMGKPMAKNVLKAGYGVVAFDFNQDAVDELVAAGAERGDSGKDVAEKTQVVVTMLPNSPNVEAALFADNGIVSGLTAGKAVIDMSSIAPKASQSFAKRLGELGVEFLDAPVSGGEPKAIDGSIAIMVGGPQATFDKYKALLETMGGDVNLVDTVPGAGNITKLANQMIVRSTSPQFLKLTLWLKKLALIHLLFTKPSALV
ncbi:NAD(P)-binding domain-containing protein [Lacticaseibacillus manihotivorans]|uniref:NAD(P)-binding domain-containing protein n=1 Tax=Lacticaseibacillus manihotivorans TaxID=88233 RepID=UPI000A609BB3